MIDQQTLIHCLESDYGIEVATITHLLLGADIDATVYKAEACNQTPYFVKVKRNDQREIALVLAELLHDAGIQQIIPPLKTRSGERTKRIESYTIIVYPFIEGQNGFSRDLTTDQWMQLGKALKQIHGVDVPPSIQKQLRREAYSPKWREAVRSFYSRIEAEPSGEKTAVQLLQFMKEHIIEIRQLVDRAEELGTKLQNQSAPFVLCHSDIHGGNVLLHENDTLYIVDWDDPIMAPKERDLMFIGGGVANVWNKQEEVQAFYKGYGEAAINLEILAYYRHERIVEDIAVYCQELLLSAAGGSSRLEMYNHFIDMFAPRGVVEIAFETDQTIAPSWNF